ncbi:MAG TPA: bifunctional 3-phosphoshikimate 1-carboxyvinyltransferase/cytidylate kinase [Burkholderiales bacterium]|nr:bifunctional 3-phosphoshikimate 1-carboxyvinyltransferase/cytidylate kinase [Burkholderiales bacterium]
MRSFPPHLDLPPLAAARGGVRLPGSKSISNRSLLLAALAEGVTEIRDLLAADDVERMLEALVSLGVRVEHAGERVRVHGCSGPFPVKQADLFLGNAGTAFRPLTAVLALCGGHYRLSGVPRMHERPIGDLVEGLRQLGADVRYLAAAGFPPLEVWPAQIRLEGPLQVRGDVSSQFVSALLMALPLLGRRAVVEVVGELVSRPYVEITLDLMARFGVRVEREDRVAGDAGRFTEDTGGPRFIVPAGQHYVSPGVLHVEGDASSASYFLAAGAIGGGPVRVQGVGRGSIQGDVRFADALAAMGARIASGENWIEAAAPAQGGLRAFDLDLNHIPDAAMTLAVAALFADGPCRLRNIASWRVKETDRLAAMAAELRKVGAEVEEGTDSLTVSPPRAARLVPRASIDTYDDHRMAMCFALVALGGVPVRINDPKCVAKTFPDFFERLAAITRPVPVIALDGPSASGKGTVARGVARALGFEFLDSGALYRLVALAALQAGIDPGDEARVGRIARDLDVGFEDETIRLARQDVTDAIRREDVSVAASRVAALPAVRAALLERQRDFRRPPGLVADGRDMGSTVFPDAVLKVFLTASPGERARRRHKQLMEKGIDATLPSLLQDIEQRDARDVERGVSPLVRCEDARLLDTTGLGAEQAIQQVLHWYREAANGQDRPAERRR